jgi:hypothetical protein
MHHGEVANCRTKYLHRKEKNDKQKLKLKQCSGQKWKWAMIISISNSAVPVEHMRWPTSMHIEIP